MSTKIEHQQQLHPMGCVSACLYMVFKARRISLHVTQEQLQRDCKMLTRENYPLLYRLKAALGRQTPPYGVQHEGIVRAIRKHNFGAEIITRLDLAYRSRWNLTLPQEKMIAYYPWKSRAPSDMQTEAWNFLNSWSSRGFPIIAIIPNFQQRNEAPIRHAIVIFEVTADKVFYLDPAEREDACLYYSREDFLSLWSDADYFAYVVG